MVYSALFITLFLCISTVFGQGNPCEFLIRGVNSTRIRQRENTTTGEFEVKSDQLLFLQNSTYIETSLQNRSDIRIGEYKIDSNENDPDVCLLLRRRTDSAGQNVTECETLTITAKSNSAEGLEGCFRRVDKEDNITCYRSCREGSTGYSVTNDLVAYIVTNKLSNQTSDHFIKSVYKK